MRKRDRQKIESKLEWLKRFLVKAEAIPGDGKTKNDIIQSILISRQFLKLKLAGHRVRMSFSKNSAMVVIDD